jgi:hypothetical protein
MHGAGFVVRERRGDRKSVRSKFVHGERATPETIAALFEEQPELQSLRRQYLGSPDLMDVRSTLAEVRALTDYSLMRNPLETSDDINRRMRELSWLVKNFGRMHATGRKMRRR